MSLKPLKCAIVLMQIITVFMLLAFVFCIYSWTVTDNYDMNVVVLENTTFENNINWNYWRINQYMNFSEYLPTLKQLYLQQLIIQQTQWIKDVNKLYNEITLIQHNREQCKCHVGSTLYCAGIGTNIVSVASETSQHLQLGKSSFPKQFKDNTFVCNWYKMDISRTCNTFFNCYLPQFWYFDSSNCTTYYNLNTSWFANKYGKINHFGIVLKYIYHGNNSINDINGNKFKLIRNTDCIAVHIRRGDVCFSRKRRKCHSFEEYVNASIKIRELYGISNIYLLTDAHDIDIAINAFIKKDFNVAYNENIDRNKYNVRKWPERRVDELGKFPVKEVMDDIDSAVLCRAFVGQFSASISKIIFALMMVDHKMIPPFISVGGCANQTNGLVDKELCNNIVFEY
eukprot:104306_1